MPTFDNAQMLSLMQCPVCYDVLRPPIYLCENSHAVCNDCHQKLEETTQAAFASCPLCRAGFQQVPSHLLKVMYDHLQVPCKNNGEGCEVVSYGHAMKFHEKKCSYRLSSCPRKNPNCDWEGPLTMLTKHYLENHA